MLEHDRSRDRDRRRILYRAEYYVGILLAWYLVPITVLLFWARYLPRHDWRVTLWQLVVTFLTIWFGTRSFRIAKAIFAETELADEDGEAARPPLPGYAPGITTFAAGILLLIVTVVGGFLLPIAPQDHSKAQRECSLDARPWLGGLAYSLISILFYVTVARLDELCCHPSPVAGTKKAIKKKLSRTLGQRSWRA